MKTHCHRGHPYTEENTYRKPDFGWRQCKECNRIAAREYARRKREAA